MLLLERDPAPWNRDLRGTFNKEEMITSLNELLRTAGLTRVRKEIEGVAFPSIRLIAQRADEIHLRLGTTKIGGSPDLPQGRTWPASNGFALPFVAQINLSDVG